jgi:UDP-N-acetyl-D-galactosamine dehydrogenase
VAEAAKVIENTQRDLNIALINELAVIFNKLNIDTEEVLKAAGTKWNFLPFRPGLVGGHCIGVDPYYLTHKAQAIGYNPEVILAGRRINDSMGKYVVSQLIKTMLKRKLPVNGANVLVMGLTFKENCPDVRNTKVVDILEELAEYDINVDVYDPWVKPDDAKKEYDVDLITEPLKSHYHAVIFAVAHNQFKALSASDIKALMQQEHVIYDLKYMLDSNLADIRL